MKIKYVNYQKEFPNKGMGTHCFSQWLRFNRYFSGKLICIGVKHHEINFDFRGDLVEELIGKKFK